MCDETVLNAEQVRDLLRRECEKMGGQAAWARAHDVTKAYVSAVLTGNHEPTRAVTYPLGLTRVVHWKFDEAKNVA